MSQGQRNRPYFGKLIQADNQTWMSFPKIGFSIDSIVPTKNWKSICVISKHETLMDEFSRNELPEIKISIKNCRSHNSENCDFKKYLDKFSMIFWKFIFDSKWQFWVYMGILIIWFSSDKGDYRSTLLSHILKDWNWKS